MLIAVSVPDTMIWQVMAHRFILLQCCSSMQTTSASLSALTQSRVIFGNTTCIVRGSMQVRWLSNLIKAAPHVT